jgi:hypothetical protein
MKNARFLFTLAVLGIAAACTAAEPTSPSAETGRPRHSTLVGSGYQVPPDTTTPPNPGAGET